MTNFTIDFTNPDDYQDYFLNSETMFWDDPDHPNYQGVDFDRLASHLKRADRFIVECH